MKLLRLGRQLSSSERLGMPRMLGPYRLLEKIADGGMGTVWRAEHRELSRPVAVKLIRAGRKADPAAKERFRMEARATAQLSSVHTVSVFDFGVSRDGVFYYIMEYLDGLDLHTLVTRFGPLPHERAVYLLVQICDALEEAHRKGLIHRDVKPSNVFLTRRGSIHDFVKVLDFGLVRAIGCDREQLTTPREVSGTPAFLPPEVAMAACIGECDVDGRADLYSLGAVAYWLLSGRTVFVKSTAMEMAVAHATETPKPLADVVSKAVPEALAELVMSCLAKEAAHRPRSAEVLADQLRSISGADWTEELARLWWNEHG